MTRQTSKSAFEAIMRNGTLSQRRRDVYEVLYRNGPLSASEVCTKLGLPRDSVSPRLSELQRLSVVREFGTKACSITGQTVVAWDVTGSLPRGSLKTKPRRRWVLAVSADKASVFQSRSEASSYAKKYKAKLVDVVECKSKPEKPAAPKAKAKKAEAKTKKVAAGKASASKAPEKAKAKASSKPKPKKLAGKSKAANSPRSKSFAKRKPRA